MNETELTNHTFAEYFSKFELPKEKIEKIISGFAEENRLEHYQKIKDVLDNSSFQLEVSEWKRALISTLAVSELTDIQRQGLKQTVIAIDLFLNQLHDRARFAKSLPALQKPQNKV